MKFGKLLAIAASSAIFQSGWSFYLYPVPAVDQPPNLTGPYYNLYPQNPIKYLSVGCQQAQWLVSEMATDYPTLPWSYSVGTASQALKGYVYAGTGDDDNDPAGTKFTVVARYSVPGDPGRTVPNVGEYGNNVVASDTNLRWVIREYQNPKPLPGFTFGYPAYSQLIVPKEPINGASDDGLPLLYPLATDPSYTDGYDYQGGNNDPLWYNKFMGLYHGFRLPPTSIDKSCQMVTADAFLCLYYPGPNGTASLTVLDGFEVQYWAYVQGTPVPG